jgi:hypothetical protein
MFDMAMEMHDLHRRASEVTSTITAVNRQMPELSKTIAARTDLPADVKASFETIDKELLAMTAKLAPPAGGRFGGGGGGGRGAAADTAIGRLTQAKNGLMGGMPATAQTHDSYKRAKADVPKAIEEANSLVAKVQGLAAVLAKHNITLTVPPLPAKSTTTQ